MATAKTTHGFDSASWFAWCRRCVVVGVWAAALLAISSMALGQNVWDGSPVSSFCVTCNVGIGTATPLDRLHVVYPVGVTGRTIFESSDRSVVTLGLFQKQTIAHDYGFYMRLQATSGDLAIVKVTNASESNVLTIANSSGNVGIGTPTPNIYGYAPSSTVLTVRANGASGLGVLELAHTYPDSVGNPVGVLIFTDPNQSGVEKRVGAILAVTDGPTANNRGGYLNFWTKADGGALSERMRIDSNGNIGIGTSPTTNRLEVSGNANFSGTVTGGNIQAKYQDLAEWVPARRRMEAGTVVVIAQREKNEVVPSSRAYDTKVAGVISAQPGLLLGVVAEGKAAVATTGRVKVKVDATLEPIRLGDLLVTSDREGMAMRSEPIEVGGVAIHRPGTLIGKALEPLEKGQGEILVLLSLQ